MKTLKTIILFAIFCFSLCKTDSIQSMDKIKHELTSIIKNNKVVTALIFAWILLKIKPKIFKSFSVFNYDFFNKTIRLAIQSFLLKKFLEIFFADLKNFDKDHLTKIKIIYYAYIVLYFSRLLHQIKSIQENSIHEIRHLDETELNESVIKLDESNPCTALIYATNCGREEMVNHLIQKKVDLNKTDVQNERTALIWATIKGHANIAKALLLAGSNVELNDKFNKSFFDYLDEIEDPVLKETFFTMLKDPNIEANILAPIRKKMGEQIKLAITSFPNELSALTASCLI